MYFAQQDKPGKSSACNLHQADFLLAYSSTLKMEATCSSETSVGIQRTTRRYIPVELITIYDVAQRAMKVRELHRRVFPSCEGTNTTYGRSRWTHTARFFRHTVYSRLTVKLLQRKYTQNSWGSRIEFKNTVRNEKKA
jgi:hypothetical protein